MYQKYSFYCYDCSKIIEHFCDHEEFKPFLVCPFCLSRKINCEAHSIPNPGKSRYIAIYIKDNVEVEDTFIQVYGENETKKIIDLLDMDDCFPAPQKLLRINDDGTFAELKMHGTWHSDDPLYIAVLNPQTNQIEFDGCGTDH